MRLAIKVLVLTAILEGASLVFAEEMVITTLILATIAVTVAAMFLTRERAETQEAAPMLDAAPQRAYRITVATSAGVETSFTTAAGGVTESA